MKKIMTVFLASMISVSSVFAAEAVNLENLIPADELEMTLSDTDSAILDDTANADVELNDRWDPPGRPGYPGRPGHPGYPGRPGHPGYPGYPGYNRVVCYATNGRGMTFDAVGQRPRQVQQWAMDECYRSSRYCRATGCHQVH